MAVLLERGHSQSAVARLLGVSEGTVRHQRKRRASGVGDGRSKQMPKAAAHAQAIAHWRDQQEDGTVSRIVFVATWAYRAVTCSSTASRGSCPWC
jgi:predicted transcriptional regulator